MGFFSIGIAITAVSLVVYLFLRFYLENKLTSNSSAYYLYNSFALILSLIALATSWMWPYLFNMFTALPAMIIALFFIQRSKRFNNKESRFHQINYVVLILAVVVALLMLIAMQSR